MLPRHMTVEQWNEWVEKNNRRLCDISDALPDEFAYIGCPSFKAVFYFGGKFYKAEGGRGGVNIRSVGSKTLNEVFERGRR